MAFFYVKAGGTATGDGGRYASAKTGTWATAFTATSEYYATLYAATQATTPPTDGDSIYCSSASTTGTATASTYIGTGGTIDGAGIKIISVDDSNVDQYKPGFTEALTTTFGIDYYFNLNVLLAGLRLDSQDNTLSSGNLSVNIRCIDCVLKALDSADSPFSGNHAGALIELYNTEIVYGNTNTASKCSNGSYFKWIGGTTANSTANCEIMIDGFNGAVHYYLEGINLTKVDQLCGPTATSDERSTFIIRNCLLKSGVILHGTMLASDPLRFEMYNCDDSTGNALHRFYIADGSGTARNNDSTYVTADEPWYEGNTKSSIEVLTSSGCSRVHPFIFELPAQYVNLYKQGSQKLTINLVTDSTAVSLTDTDIVAYLTYPDASSAATPRIKSSTSTTATGSWVPNPLAAGTTLATSALTAADWTGEPASSNFYKLEIDTSSVPGQACAVSIRIEVYKPSIAAGDLFISPEIVVS